MAEATGETVTASFPAAIRAEACVCRNEWNVASGTARPHITENELGDIGVPSGSQNTKASASCLPKPSFIGVLPKKGAPTEADARLIMNVLLLPI